MDKPEILNTTRYDTDDIWNCVGRLIPATETILDVMVRYLVKPAWSRKTHSWVLAERSYAQKTHLKLALLHPDKLDLPGMVVLARAASDLNTFAHPQVVADLIEEVANIFKTPKLAQVAQRSDLQIKLHESVDSDVKALAAFRTFKESVLSRRSIIVSRKRELIGAIQRRDEAIRQIDKLEKRIPELEAKQEPLEAVLRRRTAEMLASVSRLKESDL